MSSALELRVAGFDPEAADRPQYLCPGGVHAYDIVVSCGGCNRGAAGVSLDICPICGARRLPDSSSGRFYGNLSTQYACGTNVGCCKLLHNMSITTLMVSKLCKSMASVMDGPNEDVV